MVARTAGGHCSKLQMVLALRHFAGWADAAADPTTVTGHEGHMGPKGWHALGVASTRLCNLDVGAQMQSVGMSGKLAYKDPRELSPRW